MAATTQADREDEVWEMRGEARGLRRVAKFFETLGWIGVFSSVFAAVMVATSLDNGAAAPAPWVVGAVGVISNLWLVLITKAIGLFAHLCALHAHAYSGGATVLGAPVYEGAVATS